MPRFFVNMELSVEQQFDLIDEVHRHIMVLRQKLGDNIRLFNGNGSEYCATILELQKKFTRVVITSLIETNQAPQLFLELFLSIIANDKMDLAIQKAVELGVTNIIPVISERAQKLATDKVPKRMQHWQKIIINSCEQCGRNILPIIKLPLKFSDSLSLAGERNDLAALDDKPLRLIMLPHAQTDVLLPQKSSSVAVQLLVGPEGGFNSREINQARNAGFLPLNLGSTILRSETAAMAGIVFAQMHYGEWLANL
ncbi:MAG: 16S rRNA (uracil(1498)-N(3))-methyltransferase [Burkholderiales bacterium]|nr:16S rRNA (uracil(1498)-N(3))-methyltransferase [Burkholderiales bacterium]